MVKAGRRQNCNAPLIFLTCAVLLLAGCHRHDASRAERDFHEIQAALRQGRLELALTRADRGAKQWGDWAGSETYIQYRLLQAEVLISTTRAAEAFGILSGLRVSPEESPLEVERLALLGRALIAQRKWDEASSCLDRADKIAAAGRWDEPHLKVLIAQGILFTKRGQEREGEEVLRRALKLADQLHDQSQRMAVFMDLGFSRLNRSQFDAAIPYFEQAQSSGESAGETRGVSIALRNMAACYYELGDLDRALQLIRQTISIQEQIQARSTLVHSYGELGNIYYLKGEVPRAVPHYQQAVELAAKLKYDSGVLLWSQNLAGAYRDLGDWDRAARLNQQARNIAERIGDKDALPYLALNSASIAAGQGDRSKAMGLYTEVLSSMVAMPPSITWETHAGLAHLYGLVNDKAQASQHFERALQAIERARSGLSRHDYQITFLSQLIHFYQDYVDLLVDQNDQGKALRVADSSRARLLAERLDSEVAAGSETRVRDFRAVARSAKAVLLSYWIAPKRSVVWVITPAEERMLVLPGNGVEITKLVEEYDRELERQMRDPLKSGSVAGSRLYELLVQPVETFIPTGATVIVVPDGPLHNLNFETLPVSGPQPHYWIEQVTLSVAPSLELLAETQSRGPPPQGVLLIGNPDPVDRYPSLPNVEHEIEAIRQRFPARTMTVRTGADASPSAYRHIGPERFALIHFAAHAEANRERPLDSAVILSKQDDEFKLYARDVLATQLRAGLVTVSACESAGAKAYAGEGLVGFAWAFLHAGAKNVIAGLWKADDGSTARLMEQMYTGIAAGAAPDRALHDAKLGLIHSPGNYHKPYYWGAFQVYRRSAE